MKRRPSPTERAFNSQRMTPGVGGGRTVLPSPVAWRAPLPTVQPPPDDVLPRGATLYVAANNSTDSGKRIADPYVGDGSGDDVAVQAALDALDDPGIVPSRGGSIVCLEGDYDMTAAVVPATDTLLLGTGGYFGTRFIGSDAHATIDNQDNGALTIADIELINGGPAVHVDVCSFPFVFERVVFNGCAQALLGEFTAGQAFINYLKMLHCIFTVCGASAPIVELQRRVSKFLMIGSEFDGSDGSTLALSSTVDDPADDSEYLRLIGNQFDLDVAIEEAVKVAMSGNTGDGDLSLTNIDQVALAANVFATFTQSGLTNLSKAGNVGAGF